MNNGVNQNTSDNNLNNNGGIAPMAGVTVAPISSEPVNASNTSSATSVYQPNISKQSNSANIIDNSSMNVQSNIPPIINPHINNSVYNYNASNSINNNMIPDNKKNKNSLLPILLIVIAFLGIYIFYSSNSHKNQIAQLTYNCTPVTSSEKDIELDLESNLVKDLYSKVYTNMREDYASNDFNDEMKLYLAYRQIPNYELYPSNCNLFSSTAMEPFKCDPNSTEVSYAFKVETLQREIKKLFGEKTEIPLKNIQLKLSCIGGYQYIPSRGEYVQGFCPKNSTVPFKVEKKLLSAISNRNTIVLKEEVHYKQSEKLALPDYLKSGIYYYTFRLDMTYHYVLVSKRYESKY